MTNGTSPDAASKLCEDEERCGFWSFDKETREADFCERSLKKAVGCDSCVSGEAFGRNWEEKMREVDRHLFAMVNFKAGRRDFLGEEVSRCGRIYAFSIEYNWNKFEREKTRRSKVMWR